MRDCFLHDALAKCYITYLPTTAEDIMDARAEAAQENAGLEEVMVVAASNGEAILTGWLML